ncbi:hypothetical protein MRX96_058417 [Rhipicephalus microplus]
MLASAPCKEALTDGFHLPSKGASNWSDTARFSSWCLASRVHVVQGGPPTLLQSSSSAWNHAWQCPVFDSTTSLPVVTPIISECSSASSSPSHKFISSRHPPRDFSGHGRAAAMQSTKNPFFLLLQLLTMLASAPCKEALTDGFHLPSKGASNWSDTARFSSCDSEVGRGLVNDQVPKIRPRAASSPSSVSKAAAAFCSIAVLKRLLVFRLTSEATTAAVRSKDFASVSNVSHRSSDPAAADVDSIPLALCARDRVAVARSVGEGSVSDHLTIKPSKPQCIFEWHAVCVA